MSKEIKEDTFQKFLWILDERRQNIFSIKSYVNRKEWRGYFFFSSLVSVHAQPFTQGDYLSLNMLTLRLHTSLKDTIQ